MDFSKVVWFVREGGDKAMSRVDCGDEACKDLLAGSVQGWGICGRGVAKLLTLSQTIVPRGEGAASLTRDTAMKLPIATVALVLTAGSAFTQAQMTGVSKPDSMPITDSTDAMPPTVQAKPSAGI